MLPDLVNVWIVCRVSRIGADVLLSYLEVVRYRKLRVHRRSLLIRFYYASIFIIVLLLLDSFSTRVVDCHASTVVFDPNLRRDRVVDRFQRKDSSELSRHHKCVQRPVPVDVTFICGSDSQRITLLLCVDFNIG